MTTMILAMNLCQPAAAQEQIQAAEFSKVTALGHQLDDVMELTDTTDIKIKLKNTEDSYRQNPDDLNTLRLGIIYHETALNLSFFSKTEFKGYAQKSYDLLNGLYNSTHTAKEFLPYVASYRASALSLVGAETKKLKLLGEAFKLFDDAVQQYADVSYLPEFLRGSVSENLPWYFFSKRKFAKADFQSIIDKQSTHDGYANWKIMSFTYWAWAKQRQGKKDRSQALLYLDKAIALDPGYKAGRQKAEQLKAQMSN